MKRSKHFFSALIIFLFANTLFAQYSEHINDAQFWLFIKLDKPLTKKLSIELDQQTRVTDNWQDLSYSFLDLGFRYKISKYIHLGTSYVFIINNSLYNHNSQEVASYRHQYYFYVQFRYSIDKWKLSNRCMFQPQVKDIYSSDIGKVPVYYYRNKIGIDYELNKHFTPFFNCDIYYLLNHNVDMGNRIHRIRYFLGTNYMISKRTSIDIYYLIQTPFNEAYAETDYVVGLNFNHTF